VGGVQRLPLQRLPKSGQEGGNTRLRPRVKDREIQYEFPKNQEHDSF